MARAVLLCIALALAGCQPRDVALTPAHSRAMVDSVRGMLQDYTALVNARQWDSVAGYFANDPGFRWVEDGRVTYPSYDSVVTTFGAIGAMIRSIELGWSDVAVTPIAPGAAALTATFQETLTDTAGVRVDLRGIVTIALRHERGGWRFVVGHASSPQHAAR